MQTVSSAVSRYELFTLKYEWLEVRVGERFLGWIEYKKIMCRNLYICMLKQVLAGDSLQSGGGLSNSSQCIEG